MDQMLEGNPIRVLWAHDDKRITEVFARILETKFGSQMKIVVAESADEAESLLHETRPAWDMVLVSTNVAGRFAGNTNADERLRKGLANVRSFLNHNAILLLVSSWAPPRAAKDWGLDSVISTPLSSQMIAGAIMSLFPALRQERK